MIIDLFIDVYNVFDVCTVLNQKIRVGVSVTTMLRSGYLQDSLWYLQ